MTEKDTTKKKIDLFPDEERHTQLKDVYFNDFLITKYLADLISDSPRRRSLDYYVALLAAYRVNVTVEQYSDEDLEKLEQKAMERGENFISMVTRIITEEYKKKGDKIFDELRERRKGI